MTTSSASSSRPLAVVTGASSGIGLELARQFADHQFDLVIAAEDAGLTQAQRDLEGRGAQVTAVQVDLAAHDGVSRLWAAATATGRPIDAAALNAGVGVNGAFVETDFEQERQLIELNVTSTVRLAKLVLQHMVTRGQGKVLITSSIASTMPGPYYAVYAASKSFLQSFSQALSKELADTKVTVTALMPGPTDTNFFARAGMLNTPVGKSGKDDPAQVAKQGFDAMMSGQPKTLTGSVRTKAQGVAAKVLPDRVKAAVHAKQTQPESTG